ncbi:MAG: outer membrane lipoprotein carrier protein LolA [Bacteroidales bacterium]|nr:outer membrane lipoprotein carrier protein LolA [Bacteroidales bacterium]
MNIRYIFSILLSLVTITASAQDEMEESAKQARAALDEMSETMKKSDAIKIDFKMTSESKQTGEKSAADGSLLIVGDRYVLDLMDMVTYNDTKSVAVWQKKANEVDISEAEEDDSTITPHNLFSAYKEGYKLRMLGERKVDGVNCQEIDLYPDAKKKSNIVRIRISIDKSKKSLRQLQQQMKNGEVMTVSIQKIDTSVTVSDKDLWFDKASHPEVEIVDLR